MLQFSFPPMARFPLTLEEAAQRLSDKLVIELMFQPDTGTVSKMYQADRAEVEFLMNATPLIEEAGVVGQRINMGIMMFVRHPKLGPGWMFAETKPEARVPDDIIFQRDAEFVSRNKIDSEV